MATSKTTLWRRLPVMALALFVLLGLGIDWWRRHAAPAPAAAVRLTSGGGLATEPAISADGKLVAYASDRGGGALQVWVQPIGGGEPWRITGGDADCHAPAFSPDGALLAWRAENAHQGAGDIWVGPVRGGQPRRVAEGGRDPRFSPDGKWLAWWVRGSGEGDQIWVAPVEGGPHRRVCPQCATAHHPVWAPDGRRLVFFGNYGGNRDWYAAPLDGGPPAATGARAILRIQRFPGDVVPGAWARDGILFTGRSGKAANIWRLPILAQLLQSSAGARQLTFGSGWEWHGSAAADGTLVYAAGTIAAAAWALPLDTRRGTAAGEPERLAAADPEHPRVSVSGDGRRIALYRENRILTRDLRDGQEKELPGARELGDARMVLSPDGTRIARNQHGSLYTQAVAGGKPERLDGYAGAPLDWSGERILCQVGRRSFAIVYPASPSERPREILRAETGVYAPRFSPDGRWIAFDTGGPDSRVWIAPLGERPAAGEKEWIPVTEEHAAARDACWSADGNLLYYIAGRDGYRCIWAQPLDPKKRPRGGPVAVRHFHQVRHSLAHPRGGTEGGLAAGGGRLFFTLIESAGDVWMTRPAY